MNLSPFYIEPAQLRGIKNMVAGTYPAEPIDGSVEHTKALVVPIPKKQWEGDWVVDLENDIKWLDDKFVAGVGDGLYIKEKHRFHDKGEKITIEYQDGERRQTNKKPEDVRFTDRWLSPVCMPKWAARFVLAVQEIETRWLDEKRTQLMWVVGVTRANNTQVDQLMKDL